MNPGIILSVILLLGMLGFWLGRRRGELFVAQGSGQIGAVHSRPFYHGAFVAAFAILPALILILIWAIFGRALISHDVLSSLPADAISDVAIERTAFVEATERLAKGSAHAGSDDPVLQAAAAVWQQASRRYSLLFGGAALALAVLGGLWGWSRLRPQFRARARIENLVMLLLVAAALVAIVTTFGIVLSLFFESARFFMAVSPIEFLFGLHWSPQGDIASAGGSSRFGAVPLFWGTIFVGAIIAMIVAIPLGLMSAVYLTQYARPALRRVAKPVLEVLAGIPTVVYGFFAALTVAPAIRDLGLGLGISNASAESALAAGLVMGIMIIPFISSMADDALTAVPRALRDGSLAMGATPSETIRQVLIPAALPGIVSGVLLAVSRAIGETMIVVMAAGLAANLTANPFSSVTTVTVQMVSLLTGDQEFDSPRTLSAFALGLMLFLVTLVLNIYALQIVKKYREVYD